MARKGRRKGKIVARVFLVLGILISMTAGSALAYVKHTSDSMLALMNFDNSGTISDILITIEYLLSLFYCPILSSLNVVCLAQINSL